MAPPEPGDITTLIVFVRNVTLFSCPERAVLFWKLQIRLRSGNWYEVIFTDKLFARVQ
jgi:hypothetical protein